MAPVILGSMGYDGTTGIFFASSSGNSAYYTEGIALEFYRGWNYSWSCCAESFAIGYRIKKLTEGLEVRST